MQTDTITLGVLTLTASIAAGPIITVRARSATGDVGTLHLSLGEWTSLRGLVDVLAAADRRHTKDRAEIDVLKQEVRELEQQRDAAIADMEAAEQRMLGVLDGTFSVGDGTAQREIERLRAENERLLKMSKLNGEWIDHAADVEIDLRARLDQLQPLLSVLGDWDWRGIHSTGWQLRDYERAMERLIEAMAEVEGSIEKAKHNG